ncbi:MAG: 23S rRNA (cytosine1962-C5)-methyltransferase [Myxococcota bacterium]|jgi:23S rRNA (cytosine1962-C5)-methyltransferase
MRSLVAEALARRADLLERLAAEDTDCWRLFNGTTEGAPGLTIDRYGAYGLIQTFREPLGPDDAAIIQDLIGLPAVWRHRGRDAEETAQPDWSTESQPFRELGVAYSAPLVHRGRDPWLFLDLRAGRRWIQQNAQGRSVLNTFAYTGGSGLVAALSGATEVCQLDHGGWCLEAGEALADLNGVQIESIRADFFVALRQFAGLKLRGKAARRGFTQLPARSFGLIVLDPPTFTRGPFGAVDIVGDYASLAKPCLLSLEPGGILLATNHSARVDQATFEEQVTRCAAKAGRPVSRVERLANDADFPSYDDSPPLSVSAFHVD